MKPKDTELPFARVPLYDALPTVSTPPLTPPTASHIDTELPDHGIAIDQLFTSCPVLLRTTTDTWRPLPQSDVTCTVTASPVAVDDEGVGVGVGVGVAVDVGVGVGVGDADDVARFAQ